MTGAANNLSAQDVIGLLGLEPHPEGGHYRETFRDPQETGGRSAGTAIYFLLAAGEVSRWHRVDATEIWHWHAGAPLELIVAEEGRRTVHILGDNLRAGDRPQGIVPVNTWQSARSLGDWTLVGCTVAPGFKFSGFELAPEGWNPA